MKTHFMVIVLALVVSGCFSPMPVRQGEFQGKDYIMAGQMYVHQGPYKNKYGTIIRHDGAYKILVDEAGQAVVFGDEMSLLNYLSGQGWRYVESSVVEVRPKMKRSFMLLEKRK